MRLTSRARPGRWLPARAARDSRGALGGAPSSRHHRIRIAYGSEGELAGSPTLAADLDVNTSPSRSRYSAEGPARRPCWPWSNAPAEHSPRAWPGRAIAPSSTRSNDNAGLPVLAVTLAVEAPPERTAVRLPIESITNRAGVRALAEEKTNLVGALADDTGHGSEEITRLRRCMRARGPDDAVRGTGARSASSGQSSRTPHAGTYRPFVAPVAAFRALRPWTAIPSSGAALRRSAARSAAWV